MPVPSTSTATRAVPAFDVAEIPFSVRGAWINLSPVVGLHRRADDVHLVSHVNGLHAVLALRPVLAGAPVPVERVATPGLLRWQHAEGTVEATFTSDSAVRLRGSGLGLVLADASGGLTPFSGTYLLVDPGSLAAVFTSYETGRRYRVTVLRGRRHVENAEALGRAVREVTVGGDGLPWECLVEELDSEGPALLVGSTFDDDVARVRTAFLDYADALAPWRDATTPAAELAAYVMWSATVRPAGFLRRESVLMSKHWMDKVWSWDHCFNALALASGLPDAAWDQFLVPFDHQDANGALPDSVTHSEVLRNFVKPPIHGWTLVELRRRLPEPLDADRLRTAYDALARWSTFWLESRRVPEHVLPYYQHGNDSGWDNATTFDHDRVIESPDLAGFLALQLDVLADLSVELGLDEEGRWRKERDVLLAALVEQLWDGERFHAQGARSGTTSRTSSLLNLLPVLVADRLPPEVGAQLARTLAEHLTPYGPATEPPGSPHYEADGYWRGPIWAPSTVLVEDGLRRSGHTGLADVVSERFRGLCERSGFAENFDALTGAGLRDRAYTWTAAAYLLLAAAAVARRDGGTSAGTA